jgi:hypothetical protein
MVVWSVFNELQRTVKEGVESESSYVYTRICLEGQRKTTVSVRTGDVRVDIRSKHLPDISLEPFRYTNLLGLEEL